jgi:cell division protein FtsW (lipid II flippase)
MVRVMAFLVVGLLVLNTGDLPPLGIKSILLAGLAGAALYAVDLLVRRRLPGTDRYLLPLAAMLSIIGLVMLFRLSPSYATRQIYWLITGLVCFLLTVLGLKDYMRLEEYKYIYILGGLAALLSTILFGGEVGGARSWLAVGEFRMQPSELVKIVLVIFLASYLEEQREVLTVGKKGFLGLSWPSLRYLGPLLAMWGFSLALLIFQKDLGTALIFFATFLAMVFAATGRWSYVTAGAVLFIAGALVCYFLFAHVRVRVAIWVNPWHDIEGAGYQIVQSLFAIGSGGLLGAGLGAGRPELIPAVHTDFVFSAIAEEFGLFGGMALIIIYLLMVYRGFKIALDSGTGFGALLAAGLTSLLAIQTIVIISGVTKLLPLTGVTLPFISYGGSSLISSYILLGLLMNISRKDRESR